MTRPPATPPSLAVIVVVHIGLLVCSATAFANEGELRFETDIFPILRTHCFHCHGEEEELQGGLDLRLQRLMVHGGESGPAIRPGSADESLLLQRILDGDMPPEDVSIRPSATEIETIRRWIVAGAKTKRPEPKSLPIGVVFTEEDRAFWAFQPIVRSKPPTIAHVQQVANPIDQFVLEKLEANELGLNPPAAKRTLIRRLYFDLLGRPPQPTEMDSFMADERPDAYARLVDSLLASPQYGERWARHWLDVAGYADSEGVTETDVVRPHAWRYRDYVIRAFNAGLRYDRFVISQVAGDELAGQGELDSAEKVAQLEATGFLRMGPDGTAATNTEAARNDTIANTMDIVTSSLLGVTVACAQCHNHRYDPIPQADYYRLRAVFDPALNWKAWRTPKQRLVSLYTQADRKKASEVEANAKKVEAARTKKQAEFIQATLDKQIAKLPEEIRATVRAAQATPEKKRTDAQKKLLQENPSVNVTAGSLYLYDRKAADQLKKMQADANKIRASKPKEGFVRAIREAPGKSSESFVFHRGDFEQPGKKVDPQALSILGGTGFPVDDPSLPTTGRRLAYANWLVNGQHPLTARVFVNRVWMHHFGRGIVATPADFGRLGARPSHPKLLDWLASELLEMEWDLKRLHRLIVTSNTYQQSTARRPELDQIDSQNKLLGRMSLRRLDAESLRDSLLTISGEYVDKQFGPPVPVMADRVGQWVIGKENLNAGRPGPVLPMLGEDLRRSIYIQSRRSRPLAVLNTFDSPAMDPNCDRRASSTAATQSLMLMNGPFIASRSAAIAKRLTAKDADASHGELAKMAWRLILGVEADSEQLGKAVELLDAQAKHNEANPPEKSKKTYSSVDAKREALAVLCQALISSNAFLYVD